MTSTAPIGVFDSGLGGISVVREIRRDMPNERVLYFGDSANAPYGTKSPEQVRKLSDAIVKRFVEQGVKAVVIACNTATSAAANELRDKYDIPIIGMEPALKVACDRGHGNRQRVIVAATPLTLRERKFAVLMDRFKTDHTIFPEPCPGLVEIVEHGQLDDHDVVMHTLHQYFDQYDLSTIDSVVLGCTHFVFYRDYFRELLPGRRGRWHRAGQFRHFRANRAISAITAWSLIANVPIDHVKPIETRKNCSTVIRRTTTKWRWPRNTSRTAARSSSRRKACTA